MESNFSDAGFVRNSFDSIRKFMIRLIRKVKNNSKNSIKINSKFVRFDSTPPLVGIEKCFKNPIIEYNHRKQPHALNIKFPVNPTEWFLVTKPTTFRPPHNDGDMGPRFAYVP